jgi:hypothetical protein
LPRVFEPFVQSTQSTARSGGGLGLGLALVKNIVELHAGSVRIASDTGTRVIGRLPRVSQALDAASSAPAAVSGGRTRRVLVVDDNVDAAALLAELVRLLGHEPIIAHDGAAALAVASKLSPDLAILDLGLPDRPVQMRSWSRAVAISRCDDFLASEITATPERGEPHT